MDYRASNENVELYEALKALPKIDLHRHLEGSLRLSTMAEIANEHKLSLPGYKVDDFRYLVQIGPNDKPDAVVFLSKFKTLRHFYRSQEIIDRITYEAVADAAAENITYLELRFTPIALAREGHFSLGEVADWVIAAVGRAEKEFGITVRLIVSMNRHESVELGEKFLELAADRMDKGIVGLDLAGAENRFPGEPFAPVFRHAQEAGLSVTIHAGEWAGPGSVREAIDTLGAMRIGHGVRVIEDKHLMEEIRQRNIALEVCPTSNWQSGVATSLAEHPLKDLYHAGLLTTINTDDPSVSAINLTDELVVVMSQMGFTFDDIKQHILNAAKASFLKPVEREKLVDRLNVEFMKHADRFAVLSKA